MSGCRSGAVPLLANVVTAKGILGALAVVVVIGAAAMFLIRSREPISVKANNAVQNVIEGNAGGLMAYITKAEAQETGLSREALQQILKKMIVPYIDTARPIAWEVGESTGGINGTAQAWVYTKDGKLKPVFLEIDKTDEGPKAAVLHDVLEDAWTLRDSRSEGRHYQQIETIRAMIRGLDRDRPFLESLGLKGIKGVEPWKRVRTWTEWRAMLVDDVQQMESLTQGSTTATGVRGPLRARGRGAHVTSP